MTRREDGLRARLARIRLAVFDVDGVLTNGALCYGVDGEEDKVFHVRDGLGVKALHEAGVEVAVISGRGGAALAKRMAELGVRHLVTGRDDKGAALDEVLAETGIDADAALVVGDDVLDLPALERAAIAVAPADAHPAVLAVVDWATKAAGGRGVAREVADAVIAAREERAVGFRAVIPARMSSTRLPGKPLADIAGRPMIAHVWERAVASGAAEVLVATDDARIERAVTGFGGRVVMTAPAHASGTDRIAEVAAREGWRDGDIVVNVQGDEPLVEPALIATVAGALIDRPWAGIATAATAIDDAADVHDPAVVKVALGDRGRALYFSRAPIPYVRDGAAADLEHLRHIGLYAYRTGVLRRIAAERPRECERAEALEQLRALALGIAIHVTVVEDVGGHGVDTEDDLERVRRILGRDANAEDAGA